MMDIPQKMDLKIIYRKDGIIERDISVPLKRPWRGDFEDFSVETGINRENGGFKIRISFKSSMELIRMDYLSIPVGNPEYIVLGGMKYIEKGEERRALPNAKTSFPFDRYYSQRIGPVSSHGRQFASSIYMKMPIALMEYPENVIYAMHKPIIFSKNGVRFLSFVHLSDTLIFSIIGDYSYLHKDTPWLGRPVRKRKRTLIDEGDVLELSTEIGVRKGRWKDVVREIFEKEIPSQKEKGKMRIKKAFRRCYNKEMGCFMQLPYKKSTGFLFSDYSYNLISFESERLSAFHRAWRSTGDSEYLEWSKTLRKTLENPKFSKKTSYGRVWYNSSVYNGKSLKPFTYLGDTYGAYPGGQAEIAYNLMIYSEESGYKGMEDAIKETLDYIINTQKDDGSWPMARKDTLFFPRPGVIKRKSTGNTAACVRALANAYMIYGDKKYIESAEKGVRWLNSGNPRGYNAVLDAGLDEIEGLSAIYSIDANIEMFKATGNEKYLKHAEEWGLHSLTWVYLWETKDLPIKYTMGPFSATITPRASPYETVKLSNSLYYLYVISGDEFWKSISDVLFQKTLDFVEKDGGLSEAFSINEDRLVEIPVEQCFASTELLKSYINRDMLENERVDVEIDSQMTLKGDSIFSGDEEVMRMENGMLVLFGGLKMGFSFYDVYSKAQKRELLIKKIWRKLGKIGLLRDIPHIFRGYGEKERKKGISPWENVEKSIDIGDKNGPLVVFETDLHRIEVRIYGNERHIIMGVDVDVKEQDLDMAHFIMLPYFQGKPWKIEKKSIKFDFEDFFISVRSLDGLVPSSYGDYVGFDVTLETNWTHGGHHSSLISIEKREKH